MSHWITAAAIITAAIAIIAVIRSAEAHLVEHLDRKIHHIRKAITVSAQDVINTAVAQIRKGTAEVVGKISDLQAQIDAGVPAEELNLTELTTAAQALDDIVADKVVVDPEPEPEPVVDEPVAE